MGNICGSTPVIQTVETKTPVTGIDGGPISAQLMYQKRIAGKGVGRFIDTEDDGSLADVHDSTTVTIADARRASVKPTLEVNGFELHHSPTHVKDFKDDEEIQSVYYPEVEELVKKGTGCHRVVVFDHTLRMSSVTKLNNLGAAKTAAGAVIRVHTDYSDTSAPNRVRQLADKGSYTGTKIDPEEVEDLLAKRFTFINIWRSVLYGDCVRKPMTFCDTRSVEPSDFEPYTMMYPDRTGEAYSLYSDQSPHHKWSYYPRMTRDEIVMFKCYDKMQDGRPRFTYHTAFEHPDTPKDSGDRVSLECRCIAFWDDE